MGIAFFISIKGSWTLPTSAIKSYDFLNHIPVQAYPYISKAFFISIEGSCTLPTSVVKSYDFLNRIPVQAYIHIWVKLSLFPLRAAALSQQVTLKGVALWATILYWLTHILV